MIDNLNVKTFFAENAIFFKSRIFRLIFLVQLNLSISDKIYDSP